MHRYKIKSGKTRTKSASQNQNGEYEIINYKRDIASSKKMVTQEPKVNSMLKAHTKGECNSKTDKFSKNIYMEGPVNNAAYPKHQEEEGKTHTFLITSKR